MSNLDLCCFQVLLCSWSFCFVSIQNFLYTLFFQDPLIFKWNKYNVRLFLRNLYTWWSKSYLQLKCEMPPCFEVFSNLPNRNFCLHRGVCLWRHLLLSHNINVFDSVFQYLLFGYSCSKVITNKQWSFKTHKNILCLIQCNLKS